VDHARVQLAEPSEEEGGRCVLAGIDDDSRAADRERGAVDGQEVLGVAREIPAVTAGRFGGQHERDEAIAVDDPLKGEDLIDVEPVPAAERPVSDLAPERAGGEARSAAAELVLAHAPAPQEDELADRKDPRKLTDDALQQRAAASARPADVEDRHPAGRRPSGADPRLLGHRAHPRLRASRRPPAVRRSTARSNRPTASST
jgi:hypothetical protein